MTLIINEYVAMSRTVHCQCDGVKLVSAGGCGGLMVPERCAMRVNDGGADCPIMTGRRCSLVYGPFFPVRD